MNVAIDGPSGAGKSTIAKLVAKKMGLIYVDTGAMFRALAIYFIRTGLGEAQGQELADRIDIVQDADVSIGYDNGVQKVFLNGEDVTGNLRQEAVGNMASRISTYAQVREKLKDLQRKLAKENDVIMDGRDIGTVILPDADVKIYLTASVEVRAGRRYAELVEKGLTPVLEDIKRDIEERDYRDMNRKEAPLRQAEDAVLLDSSHMGIDEVVDRICRLIAG